MESFLEKIGGFGTYQKRMFLLLSLPTVVVSMQKLSWVFLAPDVDHRCRMWWEEENATYAMDEELKNVSYPWRDDTKGIVYDQCHYNSEVTLDPLGRGIQSEVMPCDAIVYDTSKFRTSAVIDYRMVCEQAWMRPTVQSVYMIGMLIGSYIFGDLSDRFGRKPLFLIALMMMVTAGIAQAVTSYYLVLTSLRLILGASIQGTFLIAYVMSVELVGKKQRVIVGVWAHSFYTIGYFTTTILAWLITSWWWLQAAITLPALFFIPYYWIIPESARWLITKCRSQEAKIILKKAADVNKKQVSEDVLASAVMRKETEMSKGNFLDLFRYPRLRVNTLNIFFNWMVNSGVYWGLSLNSSNLGGNPYINFMISGLVELPALVLSNVLLDHVGRRLPLCIFLALGGLALMATMFIPLELNWLLITLVMCGKMSISASYAMIYIVTAEVFPTVVRNVGVGSSSMVARIGGALAPYINLLGKTWAPMPFLIFGVLSFTASGLTLFLPETLGHKLPETLEDGENFGRKSVKQHTEEEVNMGTLQQQSSEEV